MKFTTVTVAAILVAGVAVAASKISAKLAADNTAQDIARAKATLLDISARMKDGGSLMIVASAATRTGEVPRLQQVAREARALVVPPCLAQTKDALVKQSSNVADYWAQFISGQILIEAARGATYPALAFNRDMPAALSSVCA